MIEQVFKLNRANLYMDVAKRFAQESKDPKVKVGCVIVTPSGVLYPGYNGDEIGGTNKRDSLVQGMSGFIHAEENCLIKFSPTGNYNSRMFVTISPCIMCAKKIINSCAISEVYYSDVYKDDTSGIELLQKVGILCQKLV